MSSKLSDKFAQINGSTLSSSNKSTGQRIQNRQANQTNRRDQQIAAKRGVLAPALENRVKGNANNNRNRNNSGGNRPNSAGGVRVNTNRPRLNNRKNTSSNTSNNQGGNSRPNSGNKATNGRNGRRGPNNNKKAAGGQAKAAPGKPEDLDMDLADYFHKGGKGPDPKVAALDAEMDNYFQAKTTVTAEVDTTPTTAVEM